MDTATLEMGSTTSELVERQVGEYVNGQAHFEAGLTKDLGDGVFEAVVSTYRKDRHEEKINPDGISFTEYKKNPIIFYGHDYNSLPIGKTLSIKKKDGQIVAKFQLAIEELDFAGTIGKLIKGGYLNDVSIGGRVLQWSDDFSTIEKMEMLEFSVVGIGANPDAKITQRALGITVDELRKQETEFGNKALAMAVKQYGNEMVNDSIKTLKNLLTALEASQTEAQNESDKDVKHVKLFVLKKTAQQVDKTNERLIKIIKLREEQ
jgi:HK97 family phage prohead protease